MTTGEFRRATLWLVNAVGDIRLPFSGESYLEVLEAVCNKANKYEEIQFIAKQTDYKNAVSLNEIGEDYGYHEAMYEIADCCGVKWEVEKDDI